MLEIIVTRSVENGKAERKKIVMRYCENCNSMVNGNDVYCMHCGSKLQQVFAVPKENVACARNDSVEATVGTGTFFLLGLLFAVPVIGWLAAVIFTCCARNYNVANYACACVVKGIVVMTLLMLLIIGAVAFEGSIVNSLNLLIGTEFSSYNDILYHIGLMR